MMPLTPPGVNPPCPADRMPVFQAVCGDDWILDFSLFNPVTKQPATISNTLVTMILTDNRFSTNIYWQGAWGHGIIGDNRIAGLTHVIIPKSVTSSLRRGVYTYSIYVTDIQTELSSTTQVGYIQVEYEATSPNHNIPYRQPVYSDKTQYVDKETLEKAIIEATKAGAAYSDKILKQLVAILSDNVTEEQDPSFDDLANQLRLLADNLIRAKEELHVNS